MATYRTFLADDVDSYVSVTYDEESDVRSGANLKIADCNRSVSLNFAVYGAKSGRKAQIKKNLKKLAKLQKALDKVREALDRAADKS